MVREARSCRSGKKTLSSTLHCVISTVRLHNYAFKRTLLLLKGDDVPTVESGRASSFKLSCQWCCSTELIGGARQDRVKRPASPATETA